MKFTFYHNNINVADLDKSIEFYKKALGLKITKETEAADGSFKLVFMGDDTTPHKLELTWLRDMDRPGHPLPRLLLQLHWRPVQSCLMLIFAYCNPPVIESFFQILFYLNLCVMLR